jgi:hypothetical protein
MAALELRRLRIRMQRFLFSDAIPGKGNGHSGYRM